MWRPHHALARRIAGEGIVLLKNNGILPLRNQRRIAVIGRAPRSRIFKWRQLTHQSTQVDVPYEELRKLAGAAQLTYCEGYPASSALIRRLLMKAVQAARVADVALLYVALPGFKESEGYDRLTST